MRLRKKQWTIVLTMALMLFGFGMFAQSANAASYVTVDSFYGTQKVTRVKAGKSYTWIKSDKGLYVAASKKGKGKLIVKNNAIDHMLTAVSNGKNIYYAISDTNKATIYSIGMNGENKKKIKTVKKHILLKYAYGNKIYYSTYIQAQQGVSGGSQIYSLDIKSKKTAKTKLKGDTPTVHGSGNYIIFGSCTGMDWAYGDLYSYNLKNKKMKKISKKNLNENKTLYAEKKYVYYVESDDYANPQVIKRVSFSGKNKKKIATVKGYVEEVTDKYVIYYKYNSNNQQQYYKYTYSTKKAKKTANPN